MRLKLFIGLASIIGIAACSDTLSGRDFSLPEGDAAAGKATFTELGCNACHTVSGHADLRENISFDPAMSVALGGAAPNVQTYADLVTSIVNPSHRFPLGYPKDEVSKDGASMMPSYNSIMTVEELVNLTTFLKAQYELAYYPPTPYMPYHYP